MPINHLAYMPPHLPFDTKLPSRMSKASFTRFSLMGPVTAFNLLANFPGRKDSAAFARSRVTGGMDVADGGKMDELLEDLCSSLATQP